MKTDFLENITFFVTLNMRFSFDKKSGLLIFFIKNNVDQNSPKHNNYYFSK
jgi:hypothetical protein